MPRTTIGASQIKENTLEDIDNDTKVQVEESADEDKIRFDTAGSERMIISNDGNVGIGTTSPSVLLDVDGDAIFNESGADKDFRVESIGEDEALFLDASSNTFYINKGATGFTTVIKNNNEEIIRVGAAGAIFNEYGHASNDFRIESDSDTHAFFVDSGNNKIGIGTASPAEKLDVNGNIKAGDIYVDRIRRASDSGTTTKILLNDEVIKLYAGHSSNPICTVDTAGLKINNGILDTDTLVTKAVTVDVRDVNSTSSVQATDYILRCIQTSDITVTLPAKSGNAGRVLIFKDTMGQAGSPNNNTIIIDGDSSDTIDGSATYVVDRNGESVTLTCDGVNGWMITSRVVP